MCLKRRGKARRKGKPTKPPPWNLAIYGMFAWSRVLWEHDETFYFLLIHDFVCDFCNVELGKLW